MELPPPRSILQNQSKTEVLPFLPAMGPLELENLSKRKKIFMGISFCIGKNTQQGRLSLQINVKILKIVWKQCPESKRSTEYIDNLTVKNANSSSFLAFNFDQFSKIK